MTQKIADLLSTMGWVAIRAMGGRPVDIVALPTPKPIPLNTQQPWWRPMLIQTRTTDHPYKRFSPHERQTLTELAERCGATAWLAHWPVNARHPAWIPSEHFPRPRTR